MRDCPFCKIFFLLVFILTPISQFSIASASTLIITYPDTELSSVKLYIEGMSCMKCVQKIEKKVGAIDGVSGVTVSLEHKYAIVRFDPKKTTVDKIIEVIDDAGYDVSRSETI